MTLAAILTIIQGALKFPTALTALIKLLQATPAEQQDALIKSIQGEHANFMKTGRPTWS